jgi:hypothetical protein
MACPRALVLVAVAFIACSKKSHDTTATAPAPSAVGGGAPHAVHAVIGGKALVFEQGRAFPRLGGIHVVLSTKPTSCANTGALDDAASIEIDVPPGPKGDFFAGASIGVEAWFHDAERSTAQGRAAPWQTALRLDAPPRDRVAGTIDFSTKVGALEAKASGAFDVELCDRATLVVAKIDAPMEATAAALTGDIDGAPFAPRSAIATVWRDPATGEAFVHALSLYPSAGVDCGTHFVHERAERVVVFEEIGGVSSSRTLPGPQPAAALVSIPETAKDAGPTATLHALGTGRRAWVRFDDLHVEAAKEGDVVRGAASAQSDVGAPAAETGHVDGTFTALVCMH